MGVDIYDIWLSDLKGTEFNFTKRIMMYLRGQKKKKKKLCPLVSSLTVVGDLTLV